MSQKNKKIMRVGISQRIIFDAKGASRDALEQDYVSFYEKQGIILVPIPNVISNMQSHLDGLNIDGFILSGGNDVNPKQYGAMPLPNVKYADDRDNTEREILNYAIAKNLPVLCECRGTQFLNVYFGGRLCVLNSVIPNNVGHVATHHAVKLSEPASTYLGLKEIATNSYHNQGFRIVELSKDLKSFGVCADGVIEGIYHPKNRVAGIMWHPEREPNPNAHDVALVRAFVAGELFWK